MSQRRHRRRVRASSGKSRLEQSPITLTTFLRELQADPTASRALHAAFPGLVLPSESNTMASNLDRARSASGLTALEVLEHMERFIRWCYERDAARQVDLALHLVQNELLKRRHGAEPETLSFPSAPSASSLDAEDIASMIADWETHSYVLSLVERDEDPPSANLIVFGALGVVPFLAHEDGVPVRLAQLDPDALHAALLCAPALERGVAKPRGYERTILEGAAALYRRAARTSAIDPQTARVLSARLDALAILAGGEEEQHARSGCQQTRLQ